MRRHTRILSLLLGLGMLILPVSGCSSSKTSSVPASSAEASPQSSSAAPGKTVITYWNGFTGGDGDTLKAIVDEYNKSNTKNIEVQMNIMPWDSLYQKLSTALPVGQGPDIIAFDTARIGTYAKPGALAAIDDLYSSGGIDSSLIPSTLNDNLKFEGKYYGVPQNLATLLLYYNKDMFKAAGLDPDSPPKTWDQLADDALKLTRTVNGEQQYGFGMATNNTIPMWPIMIWAGGGDIIGQDGRSVINSKANVATITKWATLIKKDKIAPPTMSGAEIDKLFESQKLAMYFCGPWTTATLDKAKVNYGLAEPPAGPAGEVTLGDAVAMVMTKSSAHKDQVYDFFKYWSSVNAQVEWSLGVGYPLARTDAISDARLAKNPNIAKFSAVSSKAHFYLPQLTNYSKIDSEVITPTLETILLKDVDIQKTLDSAADQMDQLLGK